MATDHELENHGKLIELKTLFGGLQRDVQKVEHNIQKIEQKQDLQTQAIIDLKGTIDRRRAYQNGLIAAGTVTGGGIGAKIAALLGWLS